MEFQFQFDGNTVSNPTNWADIKIKYVRDKVTRGLFTQYSSELIFVNDGYEYIKNLFDTDPCAEIECEINYRCNSRLGFDPLLTGTIQIKNAVIDKKRCAAKVVVDRNTVDELFIKHKDIPVVFSDVTDINNRQVAQNDVVGPFTVLGNATTDFQTLKIWQPAVTSSPAVAPDWFEPVSGLGMLTINPGWQGATGKYVFELFQIIVSAITDNQADFVSDHLTTRRREQVIRFTIQTAGMIAGDEITIEYTDRFGQVFTNTVEFDTAAGTTASLNVVFGGADAGGNTPDMHHTGASTSSAVLSGTVITCDVTFYFPVEITEASVSGGGSISFAETQAYVRGLSQLFLTTGAGLNYTDFPDLFDDSAYPDILPTAEAIQLSFDELFTWLNNIENLGMSIEFNGGSGRWEVRVEPMEYFYNLVSSLTIRNIADAIIQFDPEQINGAASFGNKTEIENRYTFTGNGIPDHDEESDEFKESVRLYKATDLNCKSNWNFVNEQDKYSSLGQKIAAVISGQQTYEDDLFIIEGDGNPGNTIPTAMPFRHQWKYFPSGTSGTEYYYNISLQPKPSLYNWSFNLPDMTYSYYPVSRFAVGGNALWNVGAFSTIVLPGREGYKPRQIEFERHLKLSDFLLIQSAGLITVNEGDNPANDKQAVILELEYNIATSLCRFKLLTS